MVVIPGIEPFEALIVNMGKHVAPGCQALKMIHSIQIPWILPSHCPNMCLESGLARKQHGRTTNKTSKREKW